MAFGADTNARTSFESTVYQLELPNNSQDMIDRSLFVLREKADHLRIPQAELDKERGVVLSEKRLRDTADYRAFEASMRFMLPETPIADRVPIGLESVVGNASRERLLEFYRTYYTPSRTTLVAVGAIDPAQFVELLKKNFASFHATGPDAPNPDIGRISARGLETKLHYDVEGHASVAIQAVKAASARGRYATAPAARTRPLRCQQHHLATTRNSRAQTRRGFPQRRCAERRFPGLRADRCGGTQYRARPMAQGVVGGRDGAAPSAHLRIHRWRVGGTEEKPAVRVHGARPRRHNPGIASTGGRVGSESDRTTGIHQPGSGPARNHRRTRQSHARHRACRLCGRYGRMRDR